MNILFSKSSFLFMQTINFKFLFLLLSTSVHLLIFKSKLYHSHLLCRLFLLVYRTVLALSFHVEGQRFQTFYCFFSNYTIMALHDFLFFVSLCSLYTFCSSHFQSWYSFIQSSLISFSVNPARHQTFTALRVTYFSRTHYSLYFTEISTVIFIFAPIFLNTSSLLSCSPRLILSIFPQNDIFVA